MQTFYSTRHLFVSRGPDVNFIINLREFYISIVSDKLISPQRLGHTSGPRNGIMEK